MANKFGIPKNIEEKLRARDKNCVYCDKKMTYPYISKKPSNCATLEHFREEGPFFWDENLKKEDLAICCGSCNSSRGKKKLLVWFKSDYCKRSNINEKTVAMPVKSYIKRRGKRS